MDFVEAVVNWSMPYSDQCIGGMASADSYEIRAELADTFPYTGEGFVLGCNGTVGIRPFQNLMGPKCRPCASLRPYLLDQSLDNCEDISLISSDIYLQPLRNNSNHILGVDGSKRVLFNPQLV